MHQLITSHHNPKIKSLLSLEKARERKKQCLFVIEGVQEIKMAIEGGFKMGNLFFCEELMPLHQLKLFFPEDRSIIPVALEVFQKIAIRENSGGVVAVAEQKTHELNKLKLSANPVVLVLESVEKPGNLGAILRIADAASVDAVIICDPQTDFYNPNVIRSSVGSVFSCQLASGSSEETIAWLQENKIKIMATYLKASQPYYDVDFTEPVGIVMGTESTGLSQIWTSIADQNIIIPMNGKIDSMNVSTATAVIVFEVKRQRTFVKS